MQELQSEVFLLQNGASIIIKQGSFALLQSDKRNFKMEQLIYYKVGQSLLQSGAGITKWGKYITKRSNYYKKGPYTFMTLGQMETHVCLLIRPMRFESRVL